MAKVFDSQPGLVVVPNPDLNPEYLYTLDALVQKTFGPSDAYLVELSGFYSYLIDAMVQRPFLVDGQDSIIYDGVLSGVESLVNTGSAFITGANLKFKALWHPFWSTHININYTYGKDDQGYYLRHVTPIFARVNVIYNRNRFRVDLGLHLNGEIPNERMALSELAKPDIYLKDENGGLYSPAWYTLNMKISFQSVTHILYTLGFDNMTNQRYRPYSSGIVASGFSAIFAIKYNF